MARITELKEGQKVTRRIGSMVVTIDRRGVVIRGYGRTDRVGGRECSWAQIATLGSERVPSSTRRLRDHHPVVAASERASGQQVLAQLRADPDTEPPRVQPRAGDPLEPAIGQVWKNRNDQSERVIVGVDPDGKIRWNRPTWDLSGKGTTNLRSSWDEWQALADYVGELDLQCPNTNHNNERCELRRNHKGPHQALREG